MEQRNALRTGTLTLERTGGGTPDRTLVTMLAQQAAGELFQSVVGSVTEVRVPWGGPLPGGRHAALVALTLPSGAVYVTAGIRTGSTYDGFHTGLLDVDGQPKPAFGEYRAWAAQVSGR